MKIGEKLKKLRLSKGMTQEELAERADLTRTFISQLERDLTSPSVDTLEMILRALGTDLKQFFSDQKEKVVYTKKDRIQIYDNPEGVKEEILITNAKRIEPTLVELEPGAKTEEENYHEGAEFGFVLSGTIELCLDEDKYRLKEGEAFYFTADKKHYVRNPSRKKKAKLIWIEIF